MPGFGYFSTSRISFFRSFIRTSPLFSMRSSATRSNAGNDHESAFVPRIRSGELFLHSADVREAWSALGHRPQFGMLLRRGHGEYFNTAVPPISYEATHLQPFRRRLRQDPGTPTLHRSPHHI